MPVYVFKIMTRLILVFIPFFQRIHPLSQEMSLAHCELVARSFQKDIFEKKIENPEKSIIQVFDLKIRKKSFAVQKYILHTLPPFA